MKQPAEAPLPHNRKTVHIINHLNEVLTGVPVHVWGEGINLRTTTDENGNFYLHDVWGTKKVKMKIGDAPGKLKIVPDADYYQMTVYPKKKRPWWLWLLGILLLLLLLWLLRDCSLFVSATGRRPCFTGFYCYAPGDCSGSTGFIGGTSPRYRVAG